jgi:predicted aspartyl protease
MRMRSAATLCAAIGAALLVGCAHPPPPLQTTHLEIDRSNGHFRPFVPAIVAGQPIRLLVDTGTFKSVLPANFALALHLRTASHAFDQEMIDANGMRAVAPLLPDVPVRFDGDGDGDASGGEMDFLMNPSGTRMGLLAPQDLVRAGSAVVIDLPREELRYEPEGAALKRLGEEGAALTRVDYHACLQEGFFNKLHRFVAVTINGTRADMLLDTGYDRTTLARNNPALMAVKRDRGHVLGVTSVGESVVVHDITVGFANHTFRVSAMVLPATDRCADGVLGMDVLRHCTIVWGYSSLWMACQATPGGEASHVGDERPRPRP